jgi:hypothetical protein
MEAVRTKFGKKINRSAWLSIEKKRPMLTRLHFLNGHTGDYIISMVVQDRWSLILVKINAKGRGLQTVEGQKWTGCTRQVIFKGGLPLRQVRLYDYYLAFVFCCQVKAVIQINGPPFLINRDLQRKGQVFVKKKE